jgi:hypothetical protein
VCHGTYRKKHYLAWLLDAGKIDGPNLVDTSTHTPWTENAKGKVSTPRCVHLAYHEQDSSPQQRGVFVRNMHRLQNSAQNFERAPSLQEATQIDEPLL